MTVVQNPRVTGLMNGTHLSPAQVIATQKQPIYAQNFPKPGSYTLSTVAPGFSRNDGWLLVRYVCTTLPTAAGSQYPVTIHDGSSSNTIGHRIDNSTSVTNAATLYLRSSNVNKSAESSQFPVYANEIKTAICVWRADGYQYLIVDDTFDSSTQTSARNGTLTTLQIGARAGGADALVGTVIYVEIGNTYITPEEAAARLAMCRNPLVIATAGQSNIQNWEDGVETTLPKGREGFTGVIAAIYGSANCPGEVVQIHAAEGGSYIFKELTAGTEYWIENGGQPGPELMQMFAAVDVTGHTPDFILWDQGESESHKIDDPAHPVCTRATYKARLLNVFNLMRSRWPAVQILIGRLGIRTSGYTTTYAGIQTIAEIQQELVDEYSWIHFGWERFDLTLNADGVHYQDAGYTTQGQRAARQIQRLLGYNVTGGTLGPRLVSATRVGTALTINIAHDAGTDFTPVSGIEGFTYKDSGGATIALSSIVRTSGTVINATLASGVAGTLYYIYDNPTITALSNIVKDNGAHTLPLRRGKVSVA